MNKTMTSHELEVYEAYNTDLDFETMHYEGKGAYPYAKYRMEQVLEILEKYKCKKILDLGCSAGTLVREWILRGNEGIGIDLSEKLISQGKGKIQKLGLDSDCLMVGNAKDLAMFENESFDAVIALGLYTFMTEEEEISGYKDIKRILKPKGLLITGFLNELVNMFTLNRYTVETFAKIIDVYGLSESERNKVLSEYKTLLTNPDLPPSKSSDFYRRMHNPLTIKDLFTSVGYKTIDIFFCKFFAYPPLMEKKIEFFDQSCRKLEKTYAREWYSYFLAHAFCAVAETDK